MAAAGTDAGGLPLPLLYFLADEEEARKEKVQCGGQKAKAAASGLHFDVPDKDPDHADGDVCALYEPLV